MEVAASLADTYGIIDCLSQLMCFADMLRVSGAKRVDQVLRRTEWISGEPVLSVLLNQENACKPV